MRVAHGALALRPGVRVLANELCRERLGAPVESQLAWQTWPGLDKLLVVCPLLACMPRLLSRPTGAVRLRELPP